MKRKLLSLTLVLALVLSLVPMGAFAGTAVASTSILALDKNTITADFKDGTGSMAEFTVYTRNSTNGVEGSAPVFVVSSRTGVDYVTASGIAPYALSNTSVATAGAFTTGASDGKLTFKVMTAVTGTFKVGVFTTQPGNGEVQRYINVLNGVTDATYNASTLGLIGTKEITATAGSAEKPVADNKTAIEADTSKKANGIDYHEIIWSVKSANGAPVSGQKVTFSSSNAAVTFSADEKTTDAAGIAKVKVYSTKNGSFTVEAKFSDKTSDPVTVKFAENGVGNLELISKQDQKVALDTQKNFKVKVLDTVGNQIKINADNYANVDVSVEDEPSGSSVTLTKLFYSTGELKIRTSELKKEGAYVVRAALSNGKKVDIKFTVVKQGTVTDVNFYYDESQIIPFGKQSGTPTLERVDAAGVLKDVSGSTDFEYSSSDASVATVSSLGVVTMANDKDNVGKKVVITAVDKSNKIAKTVELTVGGQPAAIKAEVPATAQVGKDAEITITAVDNKGNMVSGLDRTNTSVYAVTKPEGAIISFEEGADFASDLKAYGKTTLKLTSNKAGLVKVQILVKDASTTYSTTAEVNYGAAAVVTNKAVVLTIGSKTGFNNNAPVVSDLAPFIQDGRTFVPVSFIAAQLGGTAEFTKNAAGLVDTVTVKVGNTTVVLTIGSTTIKVVKDGKESTVTTDVAPFIKSGRTVLPFRAVAEAFGAKVSFGPETGAVEWVKFEM